MFPLAKTKAVETHFHEAFLTAQRKFFPGCVKFFKLPEMTNTDILKIPVAKSIGGGFVTVAIEVKVEECMDYLDLPNVADGLDIRNRAIQLGMHCAGTWNCLTDNAAKKALALSGKVVRISELNDVKFNMVINTEPSAVDPLQHIPGWVAFRFRFAHYVLEQ